MRILLVEDSRPLSEWLARTLQVERYQVDCSYDGEEADQMLTTETYDLVIIDLGLPKLEGRDVLRRLRFRRNPVPVMILSANNSLSGRIDSLNLGADDYLAKPFEVTELEARMRALLRRASNQKDPIQVCGGLAFDTNTRIFSAAGEVIDLTPRENALLEALMSKLGKTLSKRSLAQTLSSFDEDVSTDAIEIYVHRLRKKIEGSGATISTLRGLGYLLKPSSDN